MAPQHGQARRRNRAMLVAIFALFFGGMLVAGLLRFSGWQPQGMKNKGEMLDPYLDLRSHQLTLANGEPYQWSDAPRTWRILAAPRGCDAPARAGTCTALMQQLDTVWRLMGKDAARVHVLWIGPTPEGVAIPGELRVVRPDAVLPSRLPRGAARDDAGDGDAAWLVDPNGFVVLRYAPGFDPGALRADLARVLKVN